jgi:squalene synthase HpnC
MSTAEGYKSGKGAGDENFPVASALIARRHRPAVLAYYRFARAADDVADHPALAPEEKLATLDRLEATLLGNSDGEPDALWLRSVLAERAMSPRHALDLLTAFRMDVSKTRYADWDELMHYCTYSANPVGRYVLDVHGESEATWGPNDALCTALQVINHIQDCGKDYRALDRVYMPLDMLAADGARVEMLGGTEASTELRAALHAIAERLAALLPEAARLPHLVRDTRLAVETETIVRLAGRLTGLLLTRDPLSERVHLSKVQALAVAAGATGAVLNRHLWRAFGAHPAPPPQTSTRRRERDAA